MQFQIEREGPIPVYTQIAEQIKRLIISGELQPGQQLPTVRQLAVDLSVNPNTVARAYVMLDQEGVISTQQGRGTFVAKRADKAGLVSMRHETLRSLVQSVVREALCLGYSAEEINRVFREQLLREAKGGDEEKTAEVM